MDTVNMHFDPQQLEKRWVRAQHRGSACANHPAVLGSNLIAGKIEMFHLSFLTEVHLQKMAKSSQSPNYLEGSNFFTAGTERMLTMSMIAHVFGKTCDNDTKKLFATLVPEILKCSASKKKF